ncbi:MAG: hypothetical protein ACLSBH_14660 [Coprobacillus cateniformis]
MEIVEVYLLCACGRIESVKSLLDLVEFDGIQHVDLVAMYALVIRGCMGAIIYGQILF